MATAKLTLLGLYEWDNTLFADMVLPDGIDKDLLVSSLMISGGEFEVLYPNPLFMKQSIKVWSMKWYRTFAEWLRGTQEQFNPVYNYDRFEKVRDESRRKYDSKTTADYTDSRTADLQDKRIADLKDARTLDTEEKRTADLQDKKIIDMQDKRSADLTDTTTLNNADISSQMSASVTEHKIAAYDSSSYVPSSQDTVNNGDNKTSHIGTTENKTTGTDTTDHSGTDTTNYTGTDTTKHSGTDTLNTSGTDTMTHTGTDDLNRKGTLADVGGSEHNTDMHEAHMYGNIGVTTSFELLRGFYDISAWNLYNHICDVFIGELLIPVY